MKSLKEWMDNVDLRLDALEARNQPPKPKPTAQPGLVERVAGTWLSEKGRFRAIIGDEIARAAIDAVAEWLIDEQWWGPAGALRAELERKP